MSAELVEMFTGRPNPAPVPYRGCPITIGIDGWPLISTVFKGGIYGSDKEGPRPIVRSTDILTDAGTDELGTEAKFQFVSELGLVAFGL